MNKIFSICSIICALIVIIFSIRDLAKILTSGDLSALGETEVVVNSKEIVKLDNGKSAYYLKSISTKEFIEVSQKIYVLAKINSTMRIQHKDILSIVTIKE